MTRPNIKILAVKRNGKNGARVTLHQRLYFNGTQWQQALGISIPAEDYNAKAERVIGGAEAELYNRTLQTSKQTLSDILLRFELIEKRMPTIDEITNEYNKAMVNSGLLVVKGFKKEEPKAKLQSRIEDFVIEQSREKQWAEGTEKKFKTLKRHLDNYRKQTTFADVNEEWVYSLVNYWSDELNFDNTTVHRYVKHLRWYLRWCNHKGYYQGNLHDTFKPKLKGSEFENKTIIYLEQDELKKLEEFLPKDGQEHLARVRDTFLFACYCGLRFSDVQALKPRDIKDDMITVITEKTNDTVTINLNKHTRAILAKYEDWAKASGRCLPVISNQKANAYLHDLCRECGLDTPTKQVSYKGDKRIEVVLPKYELITFHASRRTFITHAARLGIPAEVIMKFSGHHSIEMLKPYLKIVDELKKKEMAKFDLM